MWRFVAISACIACVALAQQIPIILPPTNTTETSTNLAVLFFKGDNALVAKNLKKSFNQIDENDDGVVSVAELAQNHNATDAEVTAQISSLFGDVGFTMSGGADHNLTLDEYTAAMSPIFTRNFTIKPAICLETRMRISLCEINMNATVTDNTVDAAPTLTIAAIMAREDVKCKSGIAGLESDYAFQQCVLSSACGKVMECFGRREVAKSDPRAALSTRSNTQLDKHAVKSLDKLPTDDAQFRAYAESKLDLKALLGRLLGVSAEGSIFTILAAFIATTVMSDVWPLILPKLQAGVAGLFTGAVTAAEVAVPALWTYIGAAIIAVVVIWALVYQLGVLVDIIRDMLGGGAGSENSVLMEHWNPYAGELEPKCEWAVYTQQKCSSSSAVRSDYWGICDHGGEVYRDRECAREQWRYFYQQYCPLRRCRHMCLKSNFDCGNDGYKYMNTTEVIQSRPTVDMNMLMFNPSFSGKQYGILDARYVYRMAQCRDTCNYFKSVTTPGYSGCVGFILRAPDPQLDPRPGFQTRQVCNLIATKTGSGHVTGSSPTTGVWPKAIDSADDVFGYSVLKHNDFPPLVFALAKDE